MFEDLKGEIELWVEVSAAPKGLCRGITVPRRPTLVIFKDKFIFQSLESGSPLIGMLFFVSSWCVTFFNSRAPPPFPDVKFPRTEPFVADSTEHGFSPLTSTQACPPHPQTPPCNW